MKNRAPDNSAQKCPECSARLTDSSAGGPCPACLMKLGMQSWQENQSLQQFRLEPTVAVTGSATPNAVPVEMLAEKFPQYELLHLVGAGGMGAVYCARQTSLNRLVALKVIKPDASKRAEFADRFVREARAMAQLNHQNIITVHDFGEIDGIYYFVMEYVDGINLRQMLRSNKLTTGQSLGIVQSICDALQYAHDCGIVHRDIKPENILIDTNGNVKIADFGLAKLLDQESAAPQLTQANHVMGTMHYMAPEQIETPLAVDHRADIYSLGVVIYELLTGELPLGRFAPPSHKVSVDVRLDEIVLQTLAKEPSLRYQRVSDVKSEITSIGSKKAAANDQQQAEQYYDQAVDAVVRQGQGNVHMLQRRFDVSPGCAARMMDRMEREGVVGPDTGRQFRTARLTMNDLVAMRKYGTSAIPVAEPVGRPPARPGKPPVITRVNDNPSLPGPMPQCGMLASIFHPKTWANAGYLLLTLPLGIFYFVFTVVGLSVGFGTLIIWVGVPVLLATFAGIRGLMFFDRNLTTHLLRTNVPVFRYSTPGESSSTLRKAKELAFSGETWKGVVYMLTKLVSGILSFTFCIVFVTVPLAMVLSPFSVVFLGADMDFFFLDDFQASILACMVGLLIAPVCAWLINCLAWLNAEWARMFLSRR